MRKIILAAAVIAVGITGTANAVPFKRPNLSSAHSIRAFQHRHRLHADGVLGHQTALAYVGRFKAARAARPAPLTAQDRRVLGLPPLTAVAPVRAPQTAVPVAQQASVAPAPSGGGGLPACASESGTNYSTGADNTNSSSGATGRYQILPSTHAALCKDLGWSPGDQDACAGRIYAAQGSGAWVGCG